MMARTLVPSEAIRAYDAMRAEDIQKALSFLSICLIGDPDISHSKNLDELELILTKTKIFIEGLVEGESNLTLAVILSLASNIYLMADEKAKPVIEDMRELIRKGLLS